MIQIFMMFLNIWFGITSCFVVYWRMILYDFQVYEKLCFIILYINDVSYNVGHTATVIVIKDVYILLLTEVIVLVIMTSYFTFYYWRKLCFAVLTSRHISHFIIDGSYHALQCWRHVIFHILLLTEVIMLCSVDVTSYFTFYYWRKLSCFAVLTSRHISHFIIDGSYHALQCWRHVIFHIVLLTEVIVLVIVTSYFTFYYWRKLSCLAVLTSRHISHFIIVNLSTL